MQRKLGWMAALAAVVVGGCGPQQTPYASPSPAAGAYASPSAAAPVNPISGELAAEVVAVDTAARTVTLRESAVGGTAAASPAAGAGPVTVSVEGAAGDTLRDFKAGDRVVVSCLFKGTVGTTGTAATVPANVLSSCGSVTAIRKSAD